MGSKGGGRAGLSGKASQAPSCCQAVEGPRQLPLLSPRRALPPWTQEFPWDLSSAGLSGLQFLPGPEGNCFLL